LGKQDTQGNTANQSITQQLSSGVTGKDITEDDITKFLKWVARQAITYVLVIAMIFIILAGYIYITSLGNTTKVEQAKQMLLYTMIGVLVVMGAYLAVNTLLSQVATTPSSDPTLIAPTPSLTPAKTP
jgi:membrane protease YdiL (CAAX protease family)